MVEEYVFASCTKLFTDTITIVDETGSSAEFTKLWAPPVPIVWQATDLPLTGVPGGSITDVPTPSDPLSPLPSETGDPAPPPGPRHTTTIAIATVVPIVVIALFICGFLFFRRRGRQAQIPIPSLPELGGNDDFPKNPPPFWPAPVELPTRRAVPIGLPASPALPSELPTIEAPNSPPAAVEGVEQSVSPIESPTPYVVETPTPPSGTPPAAATPIDDDEIARLRRERDRVIERRERLLKLEALDDEERQLDRKIDARMGGAGGAV